MKIGRCVEIINPYEWLPGYGETNVNFLTKENDLFIVINYDSEEGFVKSKSLIFKGIVDFRRSSFPGIDTIGILYEPEDIKYLDKLVVFPDSEIALAWTNHFSGISKIDHYRIFFLSTNLRFDIFARGVSLQD